MSLMHHKSNMWLLCLPTSLTAVSRKWEQSLYNLGFTWLFQVCLRVEPYFCLSISINSAESCARKPCFLSHFWDCVCRFSPQIQQRIELLIWNWNTKHFQLPFLENTDHLMLIEIWTYSIHVERPKANINDQDLLQSHIEYVFMQDICDINNTSCATHSSINVCLFFKPQEIQKLSVPSAKTSRNSKITICNICSWKCISHSGCIFMYSKKVGLTP